MEITDSEILNLYKEKETRSRGFSLLVTKYQEQLYWLVRRLVVDHEDANDVIQNVFMKVFKNLDRFRGDSELYTWLYRIATNEALSFIKSKKNKYFRNPDETEKLLSQNLVDDNYFNGDEIQLKLQQAISTLPDKQKLVFNMRYFNEMPYEEMSKILGTSVGALKASYHIAVKKIEHYVKAE